MIYIEYPFTFLNEYIKAERTNWRIAAKIKRDTTYALSLMLRGKDKIKTPCGLKYTWYIPHKQRDADNIAFATKFINDALVKANIIPNDNLTHITSLHHEFVIRKGNIGVKIEIIK